MKRAGLSLVELLIAMGVMSLISLAALVAFLMSARSLHYTDGHSELLQGAQVSLDSLNRELERSTYDSFSQLNGQGLSCLSAIRNDGVFAFDPVTGKARWQDYIVYYRDALSREFRVRRVPVLGTPQENNPTPIEQFAPAQPLSNYFSDGKLLTKNLDQLNISVDAQEVVEIALSLSKTPLGSDSPIQLQMRSRTHLRN